MHFFYIYIYKKKEKLKKNKRTKGKLRTKAALKCAKPLFSQSDAGGAAEITREQLPGLVVLFNSLGHNVSAPLGGNVPLHPSLPPQPCEARIPALHSTSVRFT